MFTHRPWRAGLLEDDPQKNLDMDDTKLTNGDPGFKVYAFTRDRGSKLVRAITKVFTNKFDGPYYTWSEVPRERKERYFLEFAVQFSVIKASTVSAMIISRAYVKRCRGVL